MTKKSIAQKPLITQQRLKELLNYDPGTGVFRWRVARSYRYKPGMIAGCTFRRRCTYTRIYVDGRSYPAHRLAWLYMHGVHPTNEIDHKDGDGTHNWMDNLRDATRTINAQNERRARKHCVSGLAGVRLSSSGKSWQARINNKRKTIHIGCYATKEEAHEAYLKKKRELHPGFML